MINQQIGPYMILEKISHGGMGVVYRGIHTILDQEVAVKVLSPQYSKNPSMQKRFLNEAKIQAKLSHPNVVNIMNCLKVDEDLFLIMEYVKGQTLEEILSTQKRLPTEQAISITLSVLDALKFMHSKNVIHRDIKPSNIMITENGDVKVTDFGVAKVMTEEGKTKTGMLGSYFYMSPEQILGDRTTETSDIYSLGITLYHMLTGSVPFKGDTEYNIMKAHLEKEPLPPTLLKGDIPKDLEAIVLKSISKDPENRFKNVNELKEQINPEKYNKYTPVQNFKDLLEFGYEKLNSIYLNHLKDKLPVFKYYITNTKEYSSARLSNIEEKLNPLIYYYRTPIMFSTYVAIVFVFTILIILLYNFDNNSFYSSNSNSPYISIDKVVYDKPISSDITWEYILSNLESNPILEDRNKSKRKRYSRNDDARMKYLREHFLNRRQSEDLKDILKRTNLLPIP